MQYLVKIDKGIKPSFKFAISRENKIIACKILRKDFPYYCSA